MVLHAHEERMLLNESGQQKYVAPTRNCNHRACSLTPQKDIEEIE
jgi:hypothetical protein